MERLREQERVGERATGESEDCLFGRDASASEGERGDNDLPREFDCDLAGEGERDGVGEGERVALK